jgi:hypothetical protein
MQCVRAELLSLLLVTLAAAQNQFVYTNNQSQPNTITGFLVNSDGSLTQIAGSPLLQRVEMGKMALINCWVEGQCEWPVSVCWRT